MLVVVVGGTSKPGTRITGAYLLVTGVGGGRRFKVATKEELEG